MKLTRTQRRVVRALADGAHLQFASSCGSRCDDDRCVRNGACEDDPRGRYVLVHTCSIDVDPDGFLYTEEVQYRTLFALHQARLLDEEADTVIGFGAGWVNGRYEP